MRALECSSVPVGKDPGPPHKTPAPRAATSTPPCRPRRTKRLTYTTASLRSLVIQMTTTKRARLSLILGTHRSTRSADLRSEVLRLFQIRVFSSTPLPTSFTGVLAFFPPRRAVGPRADMGEVMNSPSVDLFLGFARLEGFYEGRHPHERVHLDCERLFNAQCRAPGKASLAVQQVRDCPLRFLCLARKRLNR